MHLIARSPGPRVAVLALLLLIGAASVTAVGLVVQEANLAPGGQAYEINRSLTGTLYVSDNQANEIWRIDPISGAYTVYQGITPQDAKPDANGDIWWADGAEVFGRINVQADTKTTWAAGLAGEVNLWGVAFDADGYTWLSEWFGFSSRLFRFNSTNNELCSFTPTGGFSSYYLIHDDGELWLGNWAANRIMRFDTTSYTLDTWQLTGDHNPVGMAADGSGNLWWADAPAGLVSWRTPPGYTAPLVPTTVGSLNFLEPVFNRLTTYTLPAGTNPQWVGLAGSTVWYTENDADTVGVLDPALASGTQSTLTYSNQTLTADCVNLAVSTPTSISTRTGTLSFTQGTWSPVLNSEGWTVFQAPAGASPFGLTHHAGTTWITDRGRQKLIKTTPAACNPFDVQPNTNHANPVACDGDVDVADIQTVAACFLQPISATCPAVLDFNVSGIIDVVDVTLVGQAWGSGVGG